MRRNAWLEGGCRSQGCSTAVQGILLLKTLDPPQRQVREGHQRTAIPIGASAEVVETVTLTRQELLDAKDTQADTFQKPGHCIAALLLRLEQDLKAHGLPLVLISSSHPSHSTGRPPAYFLLHAM
jgi:hypothetical protein